MQTTRILLVRHGATTLAVEDRFAGSSDVPLADEGREQAARLARRLAAEPVAAVYTSPLQRAMETASILGQPHDLVPTPVDGLREIAHGHWEGLSRSEVEERFAEEYAAWEADPLTCAPAGGETGISVMARALPVVHEIVGRHAGARVIVVSHKATIRLLVSSFLGFDARGYRDRLDQLPCCLNILEFRDPARARLMLFNDVSHYATTPKPPRGHLSRWWDTPTKDD